MSSRGRADRGAATIWALALVHLLLIVGLLGAAVAAQVVMRQRAAAVADIAAIAAAQTLGDPCVRAGGVASMNAMALTGCVVEGADVVVEVAVQPADVVVRLVGLLGRRAPPIRASARAAVPVP